MATGASSHAEKHGQSSFDPFQVFEVEDSKVLVCHVKVVCGRKITKGYWDMLDTPDPYVVLKVPSIPEGRRMTKCVSNTTDPVWNEEFTFCLDGNKENIMNIILMEANALVNTQIAATDFDLSSIPVGSSQKKTFTLGESGEIDCVFSMNYECHPDLRCSNELCDEEKKFREERTKQILKSMKEIFGDAGPKSEDEVPVIAVMGSGGGFRAMTAFSGVMRALEQERILDCAMYTAGLSGSTWCLSALYSHPDWPTKDVACVQEDMRTSVKDSPFRFLAPSSLLRHLDCVLEKRRQGKPISLTDFFGLMVGETLLTHRLDSKLSDQGEKLKEAKLPMPLYACVHVKRAVSARIFQEWIECTPFEMGIPKYACFIKTQNIGNKYYKGSIVRRSEEPPLHFLQGIWGSAFSILINRLSKPKEKLDPAELEKLYGSDFDEDEALDDAKPGEISSDSSDSENEEMRLEKESEGKRDVIRNSKMRRAQTWFWKSAIDKIFQGLNVLNDRSGRAGIIHNFMRGVEVHTKYPIPPSELKEEKAASVTDKTEKKCAFDGLWDLGPQSHQKYMYLVDAGLTFNSPYPLIIRPQRKVDLILSFDFTGRKKDITQPFEQLLLAYQWSLMHEMPFPRITLDAYQSDGMKEVYVFKDKENPTAPIILHFVLVNQSFKEFKKPNVRRETKEEIDFGNFSIFENPQKPYSTFNFTYEPLDYDRLASLMEYNTLNNMDVIKDAIKGCIDRRRSQKATGDKGTRM